MMMHGSVNNVRHLRRRAGMGAIDPALIGAAAGALQAGADPSGGGAMPSGGGGSNVNVPVSTQVTTAVSPVFNISAGNSGGGGVTQSGSTSQTTTPSVSNMMNQPQPGMPGGAGYLPGSEALPGSGYDPYGTGLPATSDQSYQYDSSAPMYPVQPATAGVGNMKTLLLLAAAGLAVWYIVGKQKGATTGSRRKTVPKVRKGK